jgi:hypothetical protein
MGIGLSVYSVPNERILKSLYSYALLSYCQNHSLKSLLFRRVGSAHLTLIEKVQDVSIGGD